jgi:proteasome lid subunit RPN8/RPN11
MTLQLTADQLQQITAHAERIYPEECCGVLIGQIDRSRASPLKRLLEIWEVPNAWCPEVAANLDFVLSPVSPATQPAADPQQFSSDKVSLDKTDKTDRYWIDPKDLLRAQRYARDHQLSILGTYHSHPDHTAVPSECDRSLAWAQYSYLIVSVEQGTAQTTRCWNLDAHHQFQSEEIILC